MFKGTLNNVADTNKEAAAIAGKLTVGKGANSFFLGKLAGKLPWYAKLFGKKKEIQTNPIAKMATAQLANALVTHFANDNEKLKYTTEAMVQDAMVDITRDSAMLEKMLEELENVVDIPFDLGTKSNE